MSIINPIPPQNFEIFRDLIFEAIKTEIALQSELTATVYNERVTPFDITELPAVLVLFSRFELGSKTPDTSVNSCYYNILAYTKSKNTAAAKGDELASKACQKLLGAIRYILDGPEYFKLNSPSLDSMKSKAVESIEIGKPEKQQDGAHVVVGQLTFRVDIFEQNGKIQGEAIEGADTTINEELQLTENNS